MRSHLMLDSDILHLKDIRPEQTASGMSIGGAGSKDGIVLSELFALLTIEFFLASKILCRLIVISQLKNNQMSSFHLRQ